jgi:transcriptional regulator with XRE-family HTH domain
MRHSSLELGSGSRILTDSLRAIRKRRDKSAQEVADAMGMPLRTYQQFEAGRGPLTHERIFGFADATDCDPFALLLGAILQRPELALDCADTKFCLIMMMSLDNFLEDRGSDLLYLDPPNAAGGFERLFKELGAKLDERDRFFETWLADRRGTIGLDALRQRFTRRKSRPGGTGGK